MSKRGIIFGSYDTAVNGWTLTSWTMTAALQKTNYVEKVGGDGSWDMSTALTDGRPRYKDRTLTAVFERSDGDRAAREVKIRQMIHQLDGMRLKIILPDNPGHYLVGRLHVERQYNDLAHAAVMVTATCEPWKYANAETVVSLTANSTAKTATLVNSGRRTVVPSVVVTGSSASVRLTFGTATVTLSAGTHLWPDLVLNPGPQTLTYSGTGTIRITYREAVLE